MIQRVVDAHVQSKKLKRSRAMTLNATRRRIVCCKIGVIGLFVMSPVEWGSKPSIEK
jgi:hypothetical protein